MVRGKEEKEKKKGECGQGEKLEGESVKGCVKRKRETHEAEETANRKIWRKK